MLRHHQHQVKQIMEQLYVACVGQHHKISVTQHHTCRQRLFDCDLAAAQPDDMLAQYSLCKVTHPISVALCIMCGNNKLTKNVMQVFMGSRTLQQKWMPGMAMQL